MASPFDLALNFIVLHFKLGQYLGRTEKGKRFLHCLHWRQSVKTLLPQDMTKSLPKDIFEIGIYYTIIQGVAERKSGTLSQKEKDKNAF